MDDSRKDTPSATGTSSFDASSWIIMDHDVMELSPSETSLESSSHHRRVLVEHDSEDREDNVKKQNEQSDSSYLLFWEILLCVPIILVQSVFGTFHILRSLVLGHLVQWLLQRQEEQNAFHWETFLFRQFVEGSNAWPPTSLILLAVLTIAALIVHPDGFTWILLRHTRSAFMSLFRASCTCWSMVLHEHGAIISTFLALATFAGLFLVAFALYKTLTPRNSASPKPLTGRLGGSKKKKKRRGQRTGARSRASQLSTRDPGREIPAAQGKGTTSTNNSSTTSSSLETKDSLHQELLSRVAREPALPVVIEDSQAELHMIENKMQHKCTSPRNQTESRARTMSASTSDSISTASVEDQPWDEARSVSPVPLAVPSSCTSSPATSKYSATIEVPSNKPLPPIAQGEEASLTISTPNVPSDESRPKAPVRTQSSNSMTRKSRRRNGAGSGNRKGREHAQRSQAHSKSKLDLEDSRTNSMNNIVSPPRLASVTVSNKSRAPKSKSPDDVESNSKSQQLRVIPITEPCPDILSSQTQLTAAYRPVIGTPARTLPPPPGLSAVSRTEYSPLSQLAPGKDDGSILSSSHYSSYSIAGTPYQYYQNVSSPMDQRNMSSSFGFATPDSRSFDGSFAPSPVPATDSIAGKSVYGANGIHVPSRVRTNPFATDDEILVGGSMSLDSEEDDRIEAELQELGGRMVGSILDF